MLFRSIDSWERLRELSRTRPKGLYLIAYTRLRMHPDFVPVTKTRLVRTNEGPKYTTCCLNCLAEVKRITRNTAPSAVMSSTPTSRKTSGLPCATGNGSPISNGTARQSR